MSKLYIGGMFSNKSTKLFLDAIENKYKNIKTCILIPYMSKRNFKNRNSIKFDDVFYIKDFGKIDKYINNYDCICFDEIQFIDNFPSIFENCRKLGKNIICSGLQSDFKGNCFKIISDTLPHFTKIIHLNSVCNKCFKKKGIYSIRKKNDDNLILIGSDNYIPVCSKCVLLDQQT